MGREAACRRDQVWMRNEEVQDIPWPRWLCTAVTVTEGARNGLRDPEGPQGTWTPVLRLVWGAGAGMS